MRTKAEALAKPMKGDKWAKGDSLTILSCVENSGVSFHFNGRGCFTPPMPEWCDPWLPAFRSWAANAEYLGGTDE
jgi:hypothetical protein